MTSVMTGLVLLAAVATVAAAPETKADTVVAADGSGQYKTVQEAVNAAPQLSGGDTPWTILIKPGTYRELVYIQREKRFITLAGEDAKETVITYDLNANMTGPDGQKIGTFRTPTVVIDADDFSCTNLTFENAAGRKGQALAIRIDGDRVAFRNCRFLGYQDTLFGNRGRHYFQDCYVAGAVDFIFGGATQLYENCHIHCIGGGYITASSAPENQPYGFVFANCRISGESDEVKTFLGRPWRAFGATVFLNTEMSDVVKPAGWNNWGKPDREKTARYAEFGSRGPGGETKERVPWAKQLPALEAADITKEKVFGGTDGWKP
jgi:pectinesterase